MRREIIIVIHDLCWLCKLSIEEFSLNRKGDIEEITGLDM